MPCSLSKAARKERSVESPERQFISFFSGALGLDIGLHAGGLQCLGLNEFDPIACRTIRTNLGWLYGDAPPRLYECDIRLLSSDTLQKDLGVVKEQLFAIVGGPPCQAFSTAGRRLGLNDDRGNVFLHFIDLIVALRPKYAIFENVRGLLSVPLAHRPHDQRGREFPPLSEDEKPGGALLHILRRLERGGYATSFNLYNTANFGVPQIRERLIFFASRAGHTIPDLVPSHSEDGEGGLTPWMTFREAVGNVDSHSCTAAKFPESRLQYYRLLKEGQNWRNLPQEVQRAAMGKSFHAGGGKTGFYRRLALDKPAPTLVTSPTMPATDLCHPTELRPLSVQEYAVIQTFPTDYVFEGKLDEQYRQIGNAVPCKFGLSIAQHLIAFDEGRLKEPLPRTSLSRYAGTDHKSWRVTTESSQIPLFT